MTHQNRVREIKDELRECLVLTLQAANLPLDHALGLVEAIESAIADYQRKIGAKLHPLVVPNVLTVMGLEAGDLANQLWAEGIGSEDV